MWGPAGLSCGGGSVRAQAVPEAQVCRRRDVRFACGPLALVERRPNRLRDAAPPGAAGQCGVRPCRSDGLVDENLSAARQEGSWAGTARATALLYRARA